MSLHHIDVNIECFLQLQLSCVFIELFIAKNNLAKGGFCSLQVRIICSEFCISALWWTGPNEPEPHAHHAAVRSTATTECRKAHVCV